MTGRRPAAARAPIPAAAARLLAPLADEARRRGTPLYAVGGCVRDWLLGRPNFDLDVTVAGDPDPIAEAAATVAGGTVEPFGRFGTRRVVGRGKFRFDVATTRAERYPEPAALPVVTALAVPIEQDLFRRDFTINALAARLDDGSRLLVDPYGGARDLKDGVLRVLHPASFADDPTRAFRAARFLARFGYAPAAGLEDEARAALAAGHAAKLSRHRLLHELLRVLEEKAPARAFALLRAWGYLDLLAPRLAWPAKAPADVPARLALLAASLGAEGGRGFVDSLPVEHAQRTQIHEALALAFSDKAPRTKPSALALSVARLAAPGLPAAAFAPCFLAGGDLIAAGLKPGPSFHALLDEAARLQRLGTLKTRTAALRWLKSRA